jgi:hypothetical protein
LIKDGDKALLVKCFAGCDSGDVLDELRAQGLLENRSVRRPPRGHHNRPAIVECAPDHVPDAEALAVWSEGVEPAGNDAGAERQSGWDQFDPDQEGVAAVLAATKAWARMLDRVNNLKAGTETPAPGDQGPMSEFLKRRPAQSVKSANRRRTTTMWATELLS